MTSVLGPRQTQWVEALESGKFPQIRGELRNSLGYCCLGVACEVAGIESTFTPYGSYRYGQQVSGLPFGAMAFFGFRSSGGASENGCSLVAMNDYRGLNFKGIASAVRADPSSYFTEPK